MGMREIYFYDLPVYRLPEKQYYEEREIYIEKALFNSGAPDEALRRQHEKLNPRVNDVFRGYLEGAYGGCWTYNEIIGYIRLHFLGTQVRGEYFSVARKRIVRTRTKTLEYRTHKLATEVNIDEPLGTNEVLAAILQYITRCEKELPKRFIDTTQFLHISAFVDWGSLFSTDT